MPGPLLSVALLSSFYVRRRLKPRVVTRGINLPTASIEDLDSGNHPLNAIHRPVVRAYAIDRNSTRSLTPISKIRRRDLHALIDAH